MKKTDAERVKACIARHPDWPDPRVSKATNVWKSDVASIRIGGMPMAHMSGGSAPLSAGESVSGLVSLEKVIAKYDIKPAILREVEALTEGVLLVESEMCLRTAGQDRNRFRRTVENNETELKLLRIKLKLDDSNEGKWYWGKAKTIAEAMRIRDL